MTAWGGDNKIMSEARVKIEQETDGRIRWEATFRRDIIFLGTRYRIWRVADERATQ